MINKQYEILGVSEYASNDEITLQFNELSEKYRNERFLSGEAGNEAARKLTEIETAYREIINYRHEYSNGERSLFKEVDSAIRNGDLDLAQKKLDAFNERNAEWHYLQSVVFYKKNWNNECKKQLELAKQMDPGNEKYKSAYDKLINKMNSSAPNGWDQSGTGKHSSSDEPQMGGNDCCTFCCQVMALNALLECCCNCR